MCKRGRLHQERWQNSACMYSERDVCERITELTFKLSSTRTSLCSIHIPHALPISSLSPTHFTTSGQSTQRCHYGWYDERRLSGVVEIRNWDESCEPTSLETCLDGPAVTLFHLADSQSTTTISLISTEYTDTGRTNINKHKLHNPA